MMGSVVYVYSSYFYICINLYISTDLTSELLLMNNEDLSRDGLKHIWAEDLFWSGTGYSRLDSVVDYVIFYWLLLLLANNIKSNNF